MDRRLKILISAYACSPYQGSEAGVGWGFVSELARHHDLWVIVEEEKFRADIERYLIEHPEFPQSAHFLFIHKQRNRWLRKLWPPSYYWYYRRWHQDTYRLAQQLHQEVNFDLAHQLTMIGFREPGYLWQLGIPFVWGPVGGMGLFPWRFLSEVGLFGAFYHIGYNLFNFFHMHFLKRPRQAAKIAGSGLIVANTENRDGFLSFLGVDAPVVFPVGPANFSTSAVLDRTTIQPLKIIWTGLLIPRKALNLALKAVSQIQNEIEWELHILGDGPLAEKSKLLATQLGIDKKVYFHGWLPRANAMEIMKDAHVMLFPSLREGTPSVIVEALSLGLPVICLDHSGMADMVDETCGLKIPVTTPNEVIAGLAQAIEQLARNENQRRALARGALQRAQDFNWEEKARVVDEIYRAKVAGGKQIDAGTQ